MSLVLVDRVKETSTTTGTGTYTLAGAVTGFQSFAAIGNGNTTYYTATDGTNWEVGVGTYGELTSSAALSLDFSATTTLDSRITFTRATNGTYFDSAGVLQTAGSGVARFDHRLENGVWVNKGLLIEEARTNNAQYSEQINDAYWTKSASTITANVIAAPDGSTTADRMLETATNAGHNVSKSFLGLSINTLYAVSGFVKGGLGRNEILLQFNAGSNAFGAIFNIANGTVVSTVLAGSGDVLSYAAVQDCGNGWYRIGIAGSLANFNAVNPSFQFRAVNDSGQVTYLGDVTKGYYFWGFQFETGGFPTSYIETPSNASVTRNADVASMTSTDFSSWYNATEGTMFWQGDMAGTVDSVGNWFWNINDNTANEQLTQFLFLSSGTYQTRTQVVDGGVGQLAPLTQNVSFAANQTYKTSFGYKVNDFASSTDGSAAATDTSGSLPTVDRILFGSRVTGINYLNGHIAKFYYWNTRLPNGTLQYLSSSGNVSVSSGLQRNTILESSNSNNAVDWSAGTKEVFVTFPSEATQGTVPTADDSSIGTDLVAWENFKKTLDAGVVEGVPYANNNTNGIVSTYSLVYTGSGLYGRGVLAPNGDIHFVPFDANRGQKISASGVVSTYSLVHTIVNAYSGGVLAPNGDIHFVKFSALVGQKVSASGVVSTYSLVYTAGSGNYFGGVLAPNGDIHFIPFTAPTVGQKISPSGVVSTYSLAYTATTLAYQSGVLAPNGDIHFVPRQAPVGQKISAAGVVSTYSLVYTSTSTSYVAGVLASNGDIHFVPFAAPVGQKVSISGVVSTYSLANTSSGYGGGVLAPNGDIHFIPLTASVGQKISPTGVVSTYSLVYTLSSGSYTSGILRPDGSIVFIPYNAAVGQIISTGSSAFKIETCLSSYLNNS